MITQSSRIKPAIAALSLALIGASAMPSMPVQAHDRYNAARHYGAGTFINKKHHRKFHNRYGRGIHGQRAFAKQHAPHHHVRKHRSTDSGDLIAVGIIGLAMGAIIASHSASKKTRSSHIHTHSGLYTGSTYDHNRKSSYYSTQGYGSNLRLHRSNEPRVITYNAPASLEPWSPGWRKWCKKRFRSFNPARGTYRGYDGQDHFCIPK